MAQVHGHKSVGSGPWAQIQWVKMSNVTLAVLPLKSRACHS
jgi:hypothetical protein